MFRMEWDLEFDIKSCFREMSVSNLMCANEASVLAETVSQLCPVWLA